MTRIEELNKEINNYQSQIDDTSKRKDDVTIQILLDKISMCKQELASIEIEDRKKKMIITDIKNAPKGNSNNTTKRSKKEFNISSSGINLQL